MVITQVHTISESQRGAFHKIHGMPNQDAIDGKRLNCGDGEEIFTVAIADGHGNPRHDLSKQGSQFGVKATLQVLNDILREHLQDSTDEILLQIAKSAPSMIKARWQAMIAADSFKRHVEIDEIRYGTTLLFGVFLRGKLLVAQLGDGNILVETEEKVQFLWWKPELIGSTFTDSLCSTDAVDKFKVQVFNNPQSLMLCTDGLVNSMEEPDDLEKYLAYFSRLIKTEGTEKTQSKLVENIQALNKNDTTTDDITICIMLFESNLENETKCFHAE